MIKKRSLSNQEKAEFLIRIGMLLDQGYTISEAIDLFQNYEQDRLKPFLSKLLTKLHKGATISDALAEIVMPQTILGFVCLSERYGNISKGLINSGNLLRKTELSKEKIQKLFRYPLIILWVLCLFMVIMYYFLFPQYILLFSSINVQLPLITLVFLRVIEWSPYFLFLIFIAAFSLLAYYIFVFKNKNIIHQANIYGNIPIVGPFYKSIITYSFATNLGYLVKSGLAIYDSLAIFISVTELGYISKESERIMNKLEAGEKFEDVLVSETLYLGGLAYIVKHGQTSSRLDQELAHYSDWLLNDIEERLKRLMLIVQPILFLFLGLVILLMFISILLPVFTIINSL